MSNHVTSLLRRKSLGVGLTGKAVILLMGDLASDDGEGVWASKARLARELETTDRTVQRTIDALCQAGFVEVVGKRKHQNGYTFEYRIRVDNVSACDDAHPTHRHPRHPVTPRPDRVSPKPNTTTHRTEDTPCIPQAKTSAQGSLARGLDPNGFRSRIRHFSEFDRR